MTSRYLFLQSAVAARDEISMWLAIISLALVAGLFLVPSPLMRRIYVAGQIAFFVGLLVHYAQ